MLARIAEVIQRHARCGPLTAARDAAALAEVAAGRVRLLAEHARLVPGWHGAVPLGRTAVNPGGADMAQIEGGSLSGGCARLPAAWLHQRTGAATARWPMTRRWARASAARID